MLQELIDHIRVKSHSSCYAASMPAPVAQQILTATRIIMGIGTDEGKGSGTMVPNIPIMFVLKISNNLGSEIIEELSYKCHR